MSTLDISVITNSGNIPFSMGYLARTLIPIGISIDRAYRDARFIAKQIQKLGKSTIHSDEILDLTLNWYKNREEKYYRRLSVVNNNFKEIKPLVILLGGVTGIGKSTLAQLFAARMNIKSIIGTDLIREILRVTISPSLMPTLHTSSYRAHEKLDTSFLPIVSKTIVGFEEQARAVIIGVEAAIQQAIQDQDLLVIEGVHLVPGLLGKKIINSEHVLSFQFYLKNEEIHASRLKIRETKSDARGTKYSENFKEIREIQEYLEEQAIKNKIDIIDVEDDEKALIELINMVWEKKGY